MLVVWLFPGSSSGDKAKISPPQDTKQENIKIPPGRKWLIPERCQRRGMLLHLHASCFGCTLQPSSLASWKMVALCNLPQAFASFMEWEVASFMEGELCCIWQPSSCICLIHGRGVVLDGGTAVQATQHAKVANLNSWKYKFDLHFQ